VNQAITSMRLLISWLAILLGVLMLAPLLLVPFQTPRLPPFAFEPVFRASLDQLGRAPRVVFSFKLPSGREAGDNFKYAVVASDFEKVAYCWPVLNVSVTIEVNGSSAEVQPTGPPYTWSSRCEKSGVLFIGEPGGSVRLEIQWAWPGPPPPGEIVVLRDWDNAKDRAVGDIIDADIRRWAWSFTPGAILLLCIGVKWLRART
jgi:hypothetical protein